MVFDVAPIAVHIGCKDGQRVGHVVLHTGDKVIKRFRFATLRVRKDVLARCRVQHRMVDVHGAAGFVGDGFRHEGGIAIVAQRGFADQTFEIEYLVCQTHRVTVDQIDLQLARAAFLGDAVNFEALRLCEIIDVVDHGAEFVHGGHGIGLSRSGGTARAAHHRLDFVGGVKVAGDQKEFHLGGHNGFPALRAIQLDDPL